jgi:hypothetical protein
MRALYRSADERAEILERAQGRDRLEEDLTERFRARRVSSGGGTISMRLANHPLRWATLGLALVLGAVACTTPTSTEVEMGQELTFHVPQADAAASRTFVDQTRTIADWTSARPGVDDLNVSVASSDRGGTGFVDLGLMVWGQDLDADRLVRDLRSEYPILADAVVETRDLVGKVHESMAHKLARQALSLDVSGDTADEIRANILAQLAAAGLGEGAQVDVQQGDGSTTIGVTVSTDGRQTEDIIDLVGDEVPEGVEVPVGADPTDDGDGATVVEKEEVRK